MTADIIQLHPGQQPPQEQAKPLYELYWADRRGNPMCISSRDPNRIIRQMQSLAERGITATAHRSGWPCGFINCTRGKCTVNFYEQD